ncbi:MAG TPA: NTP transferase domain-containing protein, partial [Dissulfurispiraceae bacterium]
MNLATVVLAAGLGTRMKSTLPKVLHKINGKPMVQHVADSLMRLKPKSNIIVIGKSSDAVRDAFRDYPVTFAVQKEPKGTGDALRAAAKRLDGFHGTVLIVGGDTPLINTETLREFLRLHAKNREDLSMISFIAGGRHSYGRIIREGGRVRAIVEDRDADEEQKKIN